MRLRKLGVGHGFRYHALVNYVGLIPPPPGAHFSSEWGLDQSLASVQLEMEENDFDGVRTR